jgi:hypothetical protein
MRTARKIRILSLGRLQEALQLANPCRVTHLAQGLRLNLANALPGDPELPAHFFERPAIPIHQTKALLQDLPLAFRQRLQDILDFLLQQHDCRHIAWIFGAFVLDEIAEIGLFALSHR